MNPPTLDEDRLNLSIRKYLKGVGVNSQREIETAVREAVASGRLGADEPLVARMTLELPALGVTRVIEDRLKLG